MGVRAKSSAVMLSGVAVALSGCSVESGTANTGEADQKALGYAANSTTPAKVAAASPDSAATTTTALSGTKCYARKDANGAGGVRMSFDSGGGARGVYYATLVTAPSGTYAGSFGEVLGQMTGSALSISLDPKGGTSNDLRKSAEQWTLSDKGFANGAALYAPTDCAVIDAEYAKRSNEE